MKYTIFGSLFIMSVLLSACSTSNEEAKLNTKDTKTENINYSNSNMDVKITKKQKEESEAKITKKNKNAIVKKASFRTDQKMKDAIKSIKSVSSVNLLIDSEAKNVLLDITTTTKKEKANKMAKTYAKELKEKYENYLVDVRVLNGEKVTAHKIIKAE